MGLPELGSAPPVARRLASGFAGSLDAIAHLEILSFCRGGFDRVRSGKLPSAIHPGVSAPLALGWMAATFDELHLMRNDGPCNVSRRTTGLFLRLAGFTLATTLAALSHAQSADQFQWVDDFDAVSGPLAGYNDWVSNGGLIASDPAGGDNLVLTFGGTGDRGSFRPVTLANGTSGTLYLRLRVATDNADLTSPVINWSAGLSDVALTSGNGEFADFEAQLNQNRDAGNDLPETMRTRDAGAFTRVMTLQAGVWYSIWMVIDNAADRYEVFAQGGEHATQTQLADPTGKTQFTFRNSGGGVVANDLVRFFIRLTSTHLGSVYLDDLWLDPSGRNLTNPSGNVVPPKFVSLAPANGTLFHPANSGLNFRVTSNDPGGVSADAIEVELNGQNVTSALTIGGDPANRTVAFTGLTPNTLYTGSITARDAAGRERRALLSFDTLSTEGAVLIEAEDYNYFGGEFQDNPPPSGPDADGNPITDYLTGYYTTYGFADVDFSDTTALPAAPPSPNHAYRPDDPVATQASPDARRQKYLTANVADFQVGNIVNNEWLNYTRTFPAGSYHVLLRYAATAASVIRLDRVTSDRTQPGQTVEPIGELQIANTGGAFRYARLADAVGTPFPVDLSGVQTLRLTAQGANNNLSLNFLMVAPVPQDELAPRLASVTPVAGTTNATPDTPVVAVVQPGAQPLDPASFRLFLDNVEVASGGTAVAGGIQVAHQPAAMLAIGSPHEASVVFATTATPPTLHTQSWSFTVATIPVLPPGFATPSASVTGKPRGFQVQVHKANNDAAAAASGLFPNTSLRAEQQLAGLIIDPATGQPFVNEAAGTSEGRYPEPGALNYQQLAANEGWFHAGNNYPDALYPGIDPAVIGVADPNYLALEAITYLDLTAGLHRFGVRSDDGFKVTAGPTALHTNTVIGVLDAGRGAGGTSATIEVPVRNHDLLPSNGASEFEFLVQQAGIYAFRLLHFEGTGGASLEFYSVNRTTGDRTLINDAQKPGAAVVGYQSREGDGSLVTPQPVTLGGVALEGGTFRFEFDSQQGVTHVIRYRETVQGGVWQTLRTLTGDGTRQVVTDPLGAGTRFYQVTSE